MSKVDKEGDLGPAIEKAFREDNQVLIEEMVSGREFTVGVFKTKGSVVVLPITEVRAHQEKSFFDFEAKYQGKSTETTPADLDEAWAEKIRAEAKKIYQVFNCRGVVRIDFIYHAIEVSSAFDVYLTQSNEESVAVSASEVKYRDKIRVEVKGGVLIIRYDNQGKWNTGNKKLKAYISFKDINKLEVSGACDVYIVETWKADNVKIELSGASNLKGKIDGQKLMVDLSGASDMTLSGTMGQLNIEASGASGFKGYDMVVDYCDAKASGASDIKITVKASGPLQVATPTQSVTMAGADMAITD